MKRNILLRKRATFRIKRGTFQDKKGSVSEKKGHTRCCRKKLGGTCPPRPSVPMPLTRDLPLPAYLNDFFTSLLSTRRYKKDAHFLIGGDPLEKDSSGTPHLALVFGKIAVDFHYDHTQ